MISNSNSSKDLSDEVSLGEKKALYAMQQGNKEAFDYLFRKYYPILCTYCNRFVELSDAEEIVQDVMLWLWESRESQIFESSLSSYLFRSVRNKAINRIAQYDVKQRADTFFHLENQQFIYASNTYLVSELNKLIEDAIKKLPDTYREAFVMHRFKNMTHKEIAEALGVSHQTVNYRIQQALKQLRIDLKDYLPIIFILLPHYL